MPSLGEEDETRCVYLTDLLLTHTMGISIVLAISSTMSNDVQRKTPNRNC